MSFQCLGSWAGDNGETYMSLLDTKLPQLGEDPRPRYRCAVSTINILIHRCHPIFELLCIIICPAWKFCKLIFSTHVGKFVFVKDVNNFLNRDFAFACNMTYYKPENKDKFYAWKDCQRKFDASLQKKKYEAGL